jgi:hypothetical protein
MAHARRMEDAYTEDEDVIESEDEDGEVSAAIEEEDVDWEDTNSESECSPWTKIPSQRVHS